MGEESMRFTAGDVNPLAHLRPHDNGTGHPRGLDATIGGRGEEPATRGRPVGGGCPQLGQMLDAKLK
jgi:hypothetical protein